MTDPIPADATNASDLDTILDILADTPFGLSDVQHHELLELAQALDTVQLLALGMPGNALTFADIAPLLGLFRDRAQTLADTLTALWPLSKLRDKAGADQ